MTLSALFLPKIWGQASCNPAFTVIQSGCTVTLIPTSPAGYTFENWNFGNNDNLTVNSQGLGQPITYSFNSSGTFTVVHTVQCIGTSGQVYTFQVTLNPIVMPLINVTQGAPVYDCYGKVSITYTFCLPPNTSPPTTPVTYRIRSFSDKLSVQPGSDFVPNPSASEASTSISPTDWVNGCCTKTIHVKPNNNASPPAWPTFYWSSSGVPSECIEFKPLILNTSFTPRDAVFGVTKIADVSSSSAGDLITYTVKVVNTGGSAITGGRLTEDYPEMSLRPVSIPPNFKDDGSKLVLDNVSIAYNTELVWTFVFEDITMCVPREITNKAIFDVPDCQIMGMAEHSLNSQAGNMPIINISGTMYTYAGPNNNLPTPQNWPPPSNAPADYVFAPYSQLIFNGSPSGGSSFTVAAGSLFHTAEGAEILLRTGTNFLNSTFSSCDSYMWKGIRVENNHQLMMIKCNIFDAHRAIWMEQNGGLLLFNNLFNRNYTGLYMPPLASGHTIALQSIQGNQFLCTEDLLLPYTGQSPIPAESFGLAGMELYDVKALTVSNSAARPAIFSDNAYGILAERSTVTVNKARFISPRPSVLYGNGGGQGIRAIGNDAGYTLKVTGFGSGATDPTTFEDCATGIFAQSMNIDIQKNNFRNIYDYGVRQQDGKGRVLKIIDNRFEPHKWGIFMNNNNVAQAIRVAQNKVYFTTRHPVVPLPGFAGIEINNSRSSALLAGTASHVGENFIHLEQAYTGIRAQNTRFMLFKLNKIEIHNPPPPKSKGSAVQPNEFVDGISITGGLVNMLARNSCVGFYGALTTDRNHVNGIRAAMSGNLEWCSDTVMNTNNGIRVGGICTNDNAFTSNYLQNHNYGLRLNASGILGPQTDRGNKWDYASAAPDLQAWHEGGLFAALQSKFIVKDEYPLDPQPVNPMSNWFETDGAGTPSLCDSYNGPGEPPSGANESDYRIATDNMVFPYHTEGSFFAERRGLYRKLALYPQLRTPGSVYESFYNAHQNQEIGRLDGIGSGISAALSLSSSEEATANGYEINMAGLLTQVADLDVQLLTAASSARDSLLAQKEVLLTQYFAVQGNAQSFWAAIAAADHLAFDQLWPQNENIATATQSGANEKAFNRLLLSKLLKGLPLSQSEQADLQAIAVQCPYDGGREVYAARGVLRALLGADAPVWTEDCAAYLQEGGSEDRSPMVKQNAYVVAPNPSGGSSTLSYGAAKCERSILVHDLFGRLLLQQVLSQDAGALNIDLNGRAAGIYLISVLESGKMAHQQKWVKF